MARHKNIIWLLPDKPPLNYEVASLAVLMDIRDELQAIVPGIRVLYQRLNCSDTIALPNILRRIESNTKRRARKRRTPSGRS